MKFETVVEDGQIRVQIEGHENIIISGELPMRMKHVSMAVHEELGRRELVRLREIHALAEAKLKALQDGLTIARPAATAPPPLAVFCISLLAPKNTAQALLGDLQEIFHKNVERLDEKQARHMYWMEVVANVRPLLLIWLKRIGFFTLLIDYVRSKSGF